MTTDKASKVNKISKVPARNASHSDAGGSKNKKEQTSDKSASTSSKQNSPVTMADLLKKYEGSLRSYQMNEKVKGKVTALLPGRVLIDIGGKSEGVVAEKAYKESENYIKGLKVGDTVEGMVIVPETSDGFTILSFRQSSRDAMWDDVKEVYEKETPVSIMGRMATPSGIVVDYKGINGFVPKSQVGREVAKNMGALVGKRFDALIIDFDRDTAKIIFSEKEVTEKEELAVTRNAIKGIEVGEVYEGTVTTVYDFGCFVKIDVEAGKGKEKESIPVEGLVHISEISWNKTDNPQESVKVGSKVKVKVIGKDKGKLAFSMKQVAENPWETVSKRFEKDTKVKGKVTRVSDFGVFVQLEPGVEGLVHMTKIPPGEKYKKGDEINVNIEEIDEKEKRISLGLVLTAKPLGYK